MSGFVADGANVRVGQTPEIASRLDALGRKLGVTIHAISGYRTPSHSVAVGGFANDPHTKGQAIDIGVNGSLRASAAQISDAQLASVGLYRPFGGATEINHIQLKPGSPFTGASLHAQTLGLTSSLNDIFQAPQANPAAGPTLSQAVTGDAGAAASGIVSALFDALGVDGARVLLYVALIGGGATLAGLGVSRAFGLRASELPAAAAKKTRAVAEVAAVA